MKRSVLVVCAVAFVLAACGDDSGTMDGTDVVSPPIGTPGGGMDPLPGTDAGTNTGGPAGSAAPMPGQGSGVAGCEAAQTGPDLHAAAAEILTAPSPCGFSSCHTGNGKAGLVLTEVADMSAAMVGVTSCEAPNLPLVDGSGGDAGLNNSWLWLKLTAPAMPGGVLTSDMAWGTPGNCGQDVGTYGSRMPFAGTDAIEGEARLGPIRNWICAGAPGPGM